MWGGYAIARAVARTWSVDLRLGTCSRNRSQVSLKMSRRTFALGSKACAARLAFPAATFPMGIARSTTCERELIGFQSMVCGGRCRKRRSFETSETRLARPSFGMSVFAVISRSAASSRPMLRERCADHLLPDDAAFLIAEQLSPFWSLIKVIAFCFRRSPV